MQRQQFFITAGAYLLLTTTTVQAQGPFGFGGGDRNGDDNGPFNGGCGWWGNSDDCDDGNGSGSGNSGSSSANPSQLGFSSEDISHYNKVITIHAVLACLVWVFLIPVGGILIRAGIKSPWIVRIHALLQSISFLIYVAAAALGVYLVGNLSGGGFSLWEDPHTKLGVAILILAFLQPFLGLIHHILYKRRATAAKNGTNSKRPGRTAPGFLHLWLGRILIVLGMINGGLGLRLASRSPLQNNTNTKAIAYGVGAGIMFLLYLVFVILGERRRSKERNEETHDLSRSGMPLVPQEREGTPRGGLAPPMYNQPPSYEDSQETLRKEGNTTARYS